VLIAGNWKMYKGPEETVSFCAALAARLADVQGVDVAVCPPFTSLAESVRLLDGTNVAVYAQNAHWEREGAFTGEVSPAMLAEVGADGALIGHSERRQHFCETDETVGKRIRGVLGSGLRVIACLGETEEEREQELTEAVLSRQADAVIGAVEQDDSERLTIAYEPVWAIGTGKNATPKQAQDAHAFLRGLLVDRYDRATAGAVRLLYGGSVKPENAEELLSQDDVDGALVGGASLELESFAAICETATGIRS
jgi:triosephosphate isomerase (TIM)